MLGVLVATALGMAVALAALAMADVAVRVTSADAAAERARSAADAGVAEVVERLAWGGLPSVWSPAGADSFVRRYADGSQVTVAVASQGPVAERRDFLVRAAGRAGSAQAAVEAALRVQPDRYPVGLSVADELVVEARLTLQGTQARVGGGVRGGGQVVADGPGGGADGWLAAGPAAWPPGREWLASLRSHASRGLLAGDRRSVDLAALAEAVAALPSPAPMTGPVIAVRPADGELELRGWWPLVDGQPQVTLLVEGDVRLGAPSGATTGAPDTEDAVALRGALLVTGDVTVDSTTVVVGFLAARRLYVRRPLSVIVSIDWEEAPPPGSLRVVRRRDGRCAESTCRDPRTGRFRALLASDPRVVDTVTIRSMRGLPACERRRAGGSLQNGLKACCPCADVCAGESQGRGVRGV